jgi:hypothetical protein
MEPETCCGGGGDLLDDWTMDTVQGRRGFCGVGGGGGTVVMDLMGIWDLDRYLRKVLCKGGRVSLEGFLRFLVTVPVPTCLLEMYR